MIPVGRSSDQSLLMNNFIITSNFTTEFRQTFKTFKNPFTAAPCWQYKLTAAQPVQCGLSTHNSQQ